MSEISVQDIQFVSANEMFPNVTFPDIIPFTEEEEKAGQYFWSCLKEGKLIRYEFSEDHLRQTAEKFKNKYQFKYLELSSI